MFSRVHTFMCAYVHVCIGTMAVNPPRRRAARLGAHCVSPARTRACKRWCTYVCIRTARLISRANLRACIQWVSAVNASNHPPAMATRGYYYRRAGRYSFHLQLWRVRVQRPWEFAGSSRLGTLLESGASTRTVATLHFQIIDDRANVMVQWVRWRDGAKDIRIFNNFL